MRVRTAAAISISVLTLGGLGITVASGATPLFEADLPAPGLTLDCPKNIALGDDASLTGALSGSADKPTGRQDVTITRTDEFGAPPVSVSTELTAAKGEFGPVTNTPANRGENTYQVAFGGNKDYAAASQTCDTKVQGTATTMTADDPDAVAVGDDLKITGELKTASGGVADAKITATDTVGGSKTNLADAKTDKDGAFTVTVPAIAVGEHKIDFAYAGDELLEPAKADTSVTLEAGTTLAVDPVDPMVAGKDVKVTGTLVAENGNPVAGATITATDTVGGTSTALADATTDADGTFTVTAPKVSAGRHVIDLSYAGDPPNKPASAQVTFPAKFETKLTLSGPTDLPATPETVTFTIKLTDGDGAPVADARVVLNDGGTWDQGAKTGADGTATYTKPGVSDEAPLRIDVTYAGDDTYWESSIHDIWKGTPRFTLARDKKVYTAGDTASYTLKSSNGSLPTTISLKPFKRPAIPVPPSDTGETAFTQDMFRNSTLTISTEATDRWKAGTRSFTIKVGPRINQTLAGSYDQTGDTYLVRKTRDPQLTAKVTPARPGHCVTAVVQKNVNGTYTTVKRSCQVLNTDSTASYKLEGNPAAGAKFRIRFESAADDMNIGGKGDWINLQFTN